MGFYLNKITSPEDPIRVKQAVEVLILCFYCNCVCISFRDLSSSTLLAVLVTYLHTYLIFQSNYSFIAFTAFYDKLWLHFQFFEIC